MIYFDQELRAGLDPAHNLSSWKETVKRKKNGGGGSTRKHKNINQLQETSQCQPCIMLSPTGEAGDGLQLAAIS